MSIRLLNAPFRVQRAVALAILSLVVLLAVSSMVGIVGDLVERYDTLIETRERAGKLTQFSAIDLTQLPEPTQSGDAVNLFMGAPSLTIARANLQQRITEIAVSNDILIASAGNLPDLKEDDATLIGLRVDFSGNDENVAKMVTLLEAGAPPLFVKELHIQRSGDEPADRPAELAAQLRVYSAVRIDQTAPDAESNIQ